MHEPAKCHPEREAYTHSSDQCGPCYRHAYYERNKDKWKGYATRWRSANRDQSRSIYRAWYYRKRATQRADLGPEVCGICGATDRKLYMDHDHAKYQVVSRSGWGSQVKYRGLLCNRCNVALGYIEDAELMNKALAYLRSHQA